MKLTKKLCISRYMFQNIKVGNKVKFILRTKLLESVCFYD